MTTNRWRLIVAVWAMVGMAAAGRATTVKVVDDFNDGLRNKTYWKVDLGNSTVLREKYGKLCFTAADTNVAIARWTWKTAYVLIDHDILDVIATVRMPLLLSQTGENVRYGIGFRDALNPNRYVGLSLLQMSATRWFALDKSDGHISSLSTQGTRLTPETLMLRVRYNNRYKTVGLYWKKTTETTWRLIGSKFNLNTEWGVASQRTLKPYVFGISKGAVIPDTWFQLDDFTVIVRITDVP